MILIDQDFLPAAIKLVEAATKSIYIATFKAEITTKPRGRLLKKFFDVVREKSRLGLDVRLLLNKITKMGSVPITNLYVMQELPKSGVPVHTLRNTRICHAKLLIVDDFAAIIGSHNLSVKACHNNFEISYLTQNSYVVGQLIGIYCNVWENSQKP